MPLKTTKHISSSHLDLNNNDILHSIEGLMLSLLKKPIHFPIAMGIDCPIFSTNLPFIALVWL
jgi:hypothetical protein